MCVCVCTCVRACWRVCVFMCVCERVLYTLISVGAEDTANNLKVTPDASANGREVAKYAMLLPYFDKKNS